MAVDFQRNVFLVPYTTLRIGGPAECFFEAEDVEALKAALREARKRRLPVTFLGGGSNVLIADSGVRGLVIRIAIRGIRREDSHVIAGAGTPMSDLVAYSAASGLAGLSWAGGLPGTVGGAVFGNAGTFGRAIGEALVEVRAVAPDGSLETFPNRACGFGYRTSRFKEEFRDHAIVEAVFALPPGDSAAIQRDIFEAVRFRNANHPASSSAGSFFKNPDVRPQSPDRPEGAGPREWFGRAPAGWLIDQAGCRGMRVGDAMVSEKHANFIVNEGSATAEDVRALVRRVKERVVEKFGIALQEEVRYLE